MKNRHRHSKEVEEQLTGEHTVGDAGQVIIAILFICVWITDTFILKYTTFMNRYIPLVFRIIAGGVLFVFSGTLSRKGLSIVFGEVREKPTVIRESVFGIVRHPIYLSEIILYLGFVCVSISLASVVVWIIAIVFLHFISRYEEKLLLARFGDAYELYMRDVPMWIPRLIRKRNDHSG